MKLLDPSFLLIFAYLSLSQTNHRTAAASPEINGIHHLHNCSIKHLLQLPNLGSVIELNAEYCNVTALPNAFFIRFVNLAALEITDSKLTILEDYALHGLKRLKTLSLARNNISEVKSWSNEPMSALISLDLRRNAIRQLTAKSFARYTNLQRLNLAVNLIEHIDDDIFPAMPHLKYLNLGRNRMSTVADTYFAGMHRLTHLALHYNEITSVEWEALITNTHLRSLRLEGNALTGVEFMASMNLVRLVHLNLSHNAIETLYESSFSKDCELTDLDLSYNRLQAIDGDAFECLEMLEQLNISHNSIQRIDPRSFHQLINLEHIDLSANQLTHLPADIFNGITQLQRINLSRNLLHEINATLFHDMSYLSLLDLSSNQLNSNLAEAPAFIEHLAPELNRADLQLDLSDNHFSELNTSVLRDFKRVDLAGNWWNCKWLIEEMLGGATPRAVHFGRNYSIVSAWSRKLLDVSGFDCYDAESKRSIVVLDTGGRVPASREMSPRQTAAGGVICGSAIADIQVPSPPPLMWPRVRLDKFDSRSIIIWMLIAIALAFAALRIGRQIVDQRERKKLLRQLKEKKHAQDCERAEMQKLKSNN